MLNVVSGLLGAGTPPSVGSYESIATVTVGAGGQASITFTGIPSTYKHLQLRSIAKSTSTANSYDIITLRVGSGSIDTGNNYSRHYLQGDGASTYSGGEASKDSYYYSYAAGSVSGKANMFSVNIYEILDYSNTNKYKTLRHGGGLDLNGSGLVTYGSASWQNTAAITNIKLDIFPTSTSFSQYSSFALYGIKG